MDTPEVREVERRFNLWGGFRDELVATAMTLSLVVLGSFILTERLVNRGSIAEASAVPTPEAITQTLGVSDVAPTPLPTLTALTAPSFASEGAVVFSEVPYGRDEDFDYADYAIRFRNPRIMYDSKTNTKRKFIVDVMLKNKLVADGIPVKMYASIVKNGVVIVPNAALYIPGTGTVAVGLEGTYQASISLIDGTDVREIKYAASETLPKTSHFLP
jgi:hypothetical protein